jgi:endonuclease YncB( thermonuclease family)
VKGVSPATAPPAAYIPTIDGKCTYERDLAQRAKSRLSELLSAEPFSVSRSGTDRCRRTLATVYLRDRGDVGMVLVRDGLARFWSGRRMPWYWPFLSAMNVP